MNDIVLFKSEGDLFFKIIKKKEDVKNFDSDGFVIDADEKESRRTIEFIKTKDKTKKIAVYGKSDEFNRRAIETLKIDYLISPEFTGGIDTIKQRSSGMNNYLAKKAKEKNIEILFDLSMLKNLKKKEKSKIISRLIQNIKIYRKAKVNFRIVSLAKNKNDTLENKEIASIGISLGMDTKQIKFS